MDQYLLLSMLVHVFIIVAFGDTTGGLSRTLGSVGGMTVSLRGFAPSASVPAASPGGLKMDAGRFLPPPEPATQNTVAPVAQAAAPATVADQSPAPAPQSPVPEAIAETPPVLARPVEKPVSDFVVPLPAPGREAIAPPEPGPRPALVVPPKIEPLAPAKPDAGFAAFVDAPRIPDPVRPAPLPAPLAPINPASIDSTFAPPVVLTPPTMPTLSTLPALAAPAPAPTLTPYRAPTLSNVPVQTPPPLETLPAPRINQTFSAPVEARPMAESITTPPPLTPMAPVRMDREFAVPVEVKRADITVAPPAPLAPLPPASATNELTPYVEQRARQLPANSPAPTPAAASGNVTPAVDAARLASEPSPGTTSGQSAPATGDRGREALLPGPSRTATPEGTPTPRINLDSIRDRAREIAREGTGPRTVFPSLTAPKPPAKSTTQDIFDKALKRPDCKEVYAEMGLAAVIPLVRDAVTEKGCKW